MKEKHISRVPRSMMTLLFTLVIIASILASCATPTTAPETQPEAAQAEDEATIPPTEVQAAQPEETQAEAEATEIPQETMEPSKVGGTLVWALEAEPDTLDPHRTSMSVAWRTLLNLGAGLIIENPEGEIMPYLAESWEVSEDGMTLEFTLRKDVIFSNGTPLTAEDYAFTFNRMIDPAINSPSAGPGIGPLQMAEALDDYTLRLTMGEPFFPSLFALTDFSWYQPLSKAAVEAAGENYGREPVSVGPFKFKEWQIGQKIVLERNPDFNWGPGFAQQDPAYIETLEYRILPEKATMLAGLETGEITFAEIEAQDVQSIEATGLFNIHEGSYPGQRPVLNFNVSQPPFDDILVRKAFNMAINREVMISIVASGQAQVQCGPLSSTVAGYWPGVEEMCYPYDLEQAKALMEEAGYVMGSSGQLEKDGQPFTLILDTPSREAYITVAEITQQQLKQLGVEVEIRQQEAGVWIDQIRAGDYEMTVIGSGGDEADLLYLLYHSSNIGGPNFPQLVDLELDKILDDTRTIMDPERRQQAVNEAQKRIIEQAYIIPLYAPTTFSAMSNLVEGVIYRKDNRPWLFNAYFGN